MVFVAEYRRKVVDSDAISRLRSIFAKTCTDVEAQLVVLWVKYPPTVAVAKLVNSLKGVSSRRLRQEQTDIQQQYWRGALWSPSYVLSSCGGAPVAIVRQSIEQQTPH